MISSLPYTIDSPGVYVLDADLSGPNGIVINAPNVVILGNGHTIRGTSPGSTGIKVESSEVYNISVESLIIEDFDTGIYIGSENYGFTGIIEGVVIRNATTGIFMYGYYTLYVEDTVIYASGRSTYGIMGDSVSGMVLENASLIASPADPPAPGGAAIHLYSYGDGSTGALIHGSVVEGPWPYGIYAKYTDNVLVSETRINGSGTGVWMEGSDEASLLRVSVTNSSSHGVYLSPSSNGLGILGSIISGNGGYGIYVDCQSTGFFNILLIEGNIISGNGAGGIRLHNLTDRSRDINVTGNQVMGNAGYGLEADGSEGSFRVEGNVFAGNSESPQAYDDTGYGFWGGNYWSDWSGSGAYVFTSNSDGSPLEEPMPDIVVTGIYPPSTIRGGSVASVLVEAANMGYGDARGSPLTLYWSQPPVFMQASYTWIYLDPGAATWVGGGDVVEDYGNHTLEGDDEYFIYKLPFPAEIYGYRYNYIAVSTNGYVELLNTTESNLQGEYSVHGNGYHRGLYSGPADQILGSTVIFGYSGDLAVDESYGEFVGVFNLGNDAVVVWFNGTSYEDWDPEYPVQFQIIVERDGGITVSLGDVRHTELDGDGFTGIYLAPLGTEITAGYMLPPHTSWMINTALHIASSRSIDLEGGEAANFTMPWDTGLLPHYSPYALWADANDPSDTSIYNTPAVPVVVEVAAGGPVGGRLAPAPRHAQMLPQASALLAALAAAAALAAYRARRAG